MDEDTITRSYCDADDFCTALARLLCGSQYGELSGQPVGGIIGL